MKHASLRAPVASHARSFLGAGLTVESPFAVKREVKKVAVVVFASNSSLCGGFNVNVIRHLNEVVEEYGRQVGRENILIYPVGRKVADAVKKMEGVVSAGDYQHMSGKPNYTEAADLAADLMQRFAAGEIQQVELLYNHFKSTSSQVLIRETYLPLELNAAKADDKEEAADEMQADYIIEPSPEQVMQELLPKVLRLKIYTVLLDSTASEHAARTMAMQIATDNANDLIQELTLIYNKSRQQAITNELLDIVGGTMA